MFVTELIVFRHGFLHQVWAAAKKLSSQAFSGLPVPGAGFPLEAESGGLGWRGSAALPLVGRDALPRIRDCAYLEKRGLAVRRIRRKNMCELNHHQRMMP